jgi:hypothetical protein
LIQSRYILTFTPPDDGGEHIQRVEKRFFDERDQPEKLNMLMMMLADAKERNALGMYSVEVELITK